MGMRGVGGPGGDDASALGLWLKNCYRSLFKVSGGHLLVLGPHLENLKDFCSPLKNFLRTPYKYQHKYDKQKPKNLTP